MLQHEQIITTNDFRRRCLAHPQHPVVGVCAPCLKERLSALAKTSAPAARYRCSSSFAATSSCSDDDEDEDGEERFEDAREELLQPDISNDNNLQEEEEEQYTAVASLRYYHQMPMPMPPAADTSTTTTRTVATAVKRQGQPSNASFITVPSAAGHHHSHVPYAYDADYCCNLNGGAPVRIRPAVPSSSTDDGAPRHGGISSSRGGDVQIAMDMSTKKTKTKKKKMWIRPLHSSSTANGADVVMPSRPSTDTSLTINQSRQTSSPFRLLIPAGSALPARHSSAATTETVRLPVSAADLEKPLGLEFVNDNATSSSTISGSRNNWFFTKSKSIKMADYYRSSPIHTGAVQPLPTSAIPRMHTMKPGRKSASDAVLGNNHVQYRQAYLNYAAGMKFNAHDFGLSPHAEAATDRINPSCGTRINAGGTWIPSFFRRKRRSGNCDNSSSCCNDDHSSCVVAAAARNSMSDSAAAKFGDNLQSSSANVVGTPILNGRSDRPNLKQMIKQKLKLTEPSKNHQLKLKDIENRRSRSTSPAPMMGFARGDRIIDQSTATADRAAPSGADSKLDGNDVGEKKQHDTIPSNNRNEDAPQVRLGGGLVQYSSSDIYGSNPAAGSTCACTAAAAAAGGGEADRQLDRRRERTTTSRPQQQRWASTSISSSQLNGEKRGVAAAGNTRYYYSYCKCPCARAAAAAGTGNGRRGMNEEDDYSGSSTGLGEAARSMSDLRVRSKSWEDIDATAAALLSPSTALAFEDLDDDMSNNSNTASAAAIAGTPSICMTHFGTSPTRRAADHDQDHHLAEARTSELASLSATTLPAATDGGSGGGEEGRENLLGHGTTDGVQHSTTTLANLLSRVDADKKWIGVPAPTISPCWRSKCVPDAGMTLFFHEFL